MEDFTPKKLYEQVFEQIKAQIRQGTYRQGDVLPSEKEFMEAMGVSRVTVRQALQLLSESGIIRTYKGKGSVVVVDWKSFLEEKEFRSETEIYMDEFEQAGKVRRILEPSIARQAALCATEEEIALMEKALLKESSGPSGEIPGKRDTQGLPEFHRCISNCLKNPMMNQILEELIEKSASPYKIPMIPPTRQKQHKEEVSRQHRNIFEAIKNHDPDYAYYHMLAHCDWIYETYEKYFCDFLK